MGSWWRVGRGQRRAGTLRDDTEEIRSVVSVGSDPLGGLGIHSDLPFGLLCFINFC